MHLCLGQWQWRGFLIFSGLWVSETGPQCAWETWRGPGGRALFTHGCPHDASSSLPCGSWVAGRWVGSRRWQRRLHTRMHFTDAERGGTPVVEVTVSVAVAAAVFGRIAPGPRPRSRLH